MKAKAVSVIYYNPANLYTVVVFETEEKIPDAAVSECFGGKYRFSVTGTGLPTRKGTECVLEGRWTKSRKYGTQFKAEQFSELLPADAEGAEAYLSSGIVRGIGPKMAERIVKKFGGKTFEIMEKEPEKLLTVRGISKKKLAVITSAWEENREDKELMGFLMKYGISRAKIKKIREQLEADLVIVDEFSMVDMRLAANLFAGIKTGTRLVMVGDIDQLPSVGAGNVFRELIRSGLIPVTTLDVVFRQEEGSDIVGNSRRINQGCAKLEYGDDFIFHSVSTVEEAADLVVQMYKDEISKAGATGQSVQILSPFRKSTEAGTVALNKRLQSEMNPYAGTRQEVVAVYPDSRMAVYTPEDAGLVGLSYATTIHKSQGSEYPVVIVPMLEAFHIMLKRNLLYTAVTRASKKVILIGQWRAVYQAIRTDDVEKRNTLFARRLVAECRQKAA